MDSTVLQNILNHAGKTEEHVVGFRLANGARVMFLDGFDMETNMLDNIGILYKKLEDGYGRIAHSYTIQDEVIQVILRDNLNESLCVRDIIE